MIFEDEDDTGKHDILLSDKSQDARVCIYYDPNYAHKFSYLFLICSTLSIANSTGEPTCVPSPSAPGEAESNGLKTLMVVVPGLRGCGSFGFLTLFFSEFSKSLFCLFPY